VIGTGVDLVECARIQRSIDRFGDRFLHRVFTDGEIQYSTSMKFPARHLAARFAAKEAVSKAFLVLSGPAKELATRRGITAALVTLSHTEHHAVACVVLEGMPS